MGGRAAEELLFHEVTGGASNDFETANQIATAMVTRWGMGRDPEATDGGDLRPRLALVPRPDRRAVAPVRRPGRGDARDPGDPRRRLRRGAAATLVDAHRARCAGSPPTSSSTSGSTARRSTSCSTAGGPSRRPMKSGARRRRGRAPGATSWTSRRGGSARRSSPRPCRSRPWRTRPRSRRLRTAVPSSVAATSPAAALEAPQAAVSSVATASVASIEARPEGPVLDADARRAGRRRRRSVRRPQPSSPDRALAAGPSSARPARPPPACSVARSAGSAPASWRPTGSSARTTSRLGYPLAVPLISARALTKRYPGGVTALDGLTVDIEPGHRRARRLERRRQEHADQDPARAHRPDERHRRRSSTSTSGRKGTDIRQFVGYMPEHDCLPPDVSATDVVSHLALMSGLPRTAARERTAEVLRHVGPVRGALPGDRRLLDRDEAAGQARPGARPRPAAAAPRRADERPRSGRPRRDARADPADRPRVRDRGHRRLAPPRRDRAGLQLPRRDRGRQAPARGAARRLHRADRDARGRGRGRQRRARGAASPPPGSHTIVDGRAVLIALDGDRPYDLVRDTVADLGLPLVRIEQRRHRLEDLFRDAPEDGARRRSAASGAAASRARSHGRAAGMTAPLPVDSPTGSIYDLGYRGYDRTPARSRLRDPVAVHAQPPDDLRPRTDDRAKLAPCSSLVFASCRRSRSSPRSSSSPGSAARSARSSARTRRSATTRCSRS